MLVISHFTTLALISTSTRSTRRSYFRVTLELLWSDSGGSLVGLPSRHGIVYIDNSTAVIVTIVFDLLLMIFFGFLIGLNRRILILSNLINEGKEKVLEKWEDFLCVDKGHYTNLCYH